MSGKANIVHRKDMRRWLIKLLCSTREEEVRPELLVARSLGITNMSDIILSRKRLPFLDELCDAKGVVGESVMYLTKDDKDRKTASILKDGSSDMEKSLN